MKEVVICDAYHFLEAGRHMHDCGKRIHAALAIASKDRVNIEQLAAELDAAAEDYTQCALAMTEALQGL